MYERSPLIDRPYGMDQDMARKVLENGSSYLTQMREQAIIVLGDAILPQAWDADLLLSTLSFPQHRMSALVALYRVVGKLDELGRLHKSMRGFFSEDLIALSSYWEEPEMLKISEEILAILQT